MLARMRGLALIGIVAALAACRTSSPVTLTLPSGEVLRGGASTSVNGQYFVRSGQLTCSGTFEGRTVGGVGLTFKRKSPVTASCSNGKTATSEDDLWETGRAELKFSDGTRGRITVEN